MALSAAQYAQLKLNLRALGSANRYVLANLSDSELLAFWNQLAAEAAGGVALSAAQDAAVDRTFRAMLCANNSLISLPDADWTSFFTQLTIDATGISALPAGQYAAVKLQLRALISGYSVTPFNLSDAGLLGYLKTRVGVSTPLTIITSVPVRLWLRADLGVTLATGVSHWIDQSGNAYDLAQATAGLQPTYTASDATLNNTPTMAGDGVSKFLFSAGATITASYWRCSVAKYAAFAVNDRLMDSAGGGSVIGQGAPNILLFEPGLTTPNNAGFGAINTWKRIAEQESNAVTDSIKVGSVTATGTALGRVGARANLTIFSAFGGGNCANASLAEIIVTDGIPTPAEQNAIDGYLSSRYLPSILT